MSWRGQQKAWKTFFQFDFISFECATTHIHGKTYLIGFWRMSAAPLARIAAETNELLAICSGST
jgi:hypothetical protein